MDNKLRLLIVEDEKDDLKVCRNTIKRYQDQHRCRVEYVECRNVEKAFEELDNSFDGAIIDLNLGDQGNEGNQVVSRIKESGLWIPVFILTGTPDPVDRDDPYIKVFRKGDPGAPLCQDR